jgi:hypothetical protein
MKHLKKFNESINREELQDFCDTYLAYLLDNDEFKVYVSRHSTAISLVKGRREEYKALNSPEFIFTWDEIKDYFIPFLHMLSKQSPITRIKFWNLNRRFDPNKLDGIGNDLYLDYDYDLSMVLDDKVSLEQITQINIYLK